MTATKPLILSSEMVQMLRGERRYTEESKDLSELGISYYQAGYAGRTYAAPGFPTWPVELMVSFLLACWEQGRKDAGARARATGYRKLQIAPGGRT